MKKVKKVSDEKILNKQVTIKLSASEYQKFKDQASYENITLTEFIRNSISEKIRGVELTESIEAVVNAGIQRIETASHLNKTNQEILRKLVDLEEKVALKSDFEEHKKEVMEDVNSLKFSFKKEFGEMGSSFSKLIKFIDETGKSSHKKQTKELNGIRRDVFLTAFSIAKIARKDQIIINKDEAIAEFNNEILKENAKLEVNNNAN